MRACLLGGLLMLGLLHSAQAQLDTPKPPIALDAEQEARYHELLPLLRCLVCQNQSLADSQAPLAEDLRHEVRGLIAQGHSDAEVKQYLVARYGDFVLYKPPLEARTVLLWAGPLLFVLLGLGALMLYGRRSSPATAPDAQALRRLLDEET
jgi:cytochrome c-type biogenesis protein CcmH